MFHRNREFSEMTLEFVKMVSGPTEMPMVEKYNERQKERFMVNGPCQNFKGFKECILVQEVNSIVFHEASTKDLSKKRKG